MGYPILRALKHLTLNAFKANLIPTNPTYFDNTGSLITPKDIITQQGNTFNGANQLVKLDANSKLPFCDGTNVSNLNATTKRRILLSNNAINPNTQIDFSIGTVTSSDETFAIYNPSIQTGDLSLNFGNGIGMLDVGTKANSTWYYLFAIYNPTTLTTKFLASATAPNSTTGAYAGANMPAGYTVGKYIGALLTNASGNIVPGTWRQDGSFKFKAPIINLSRVVNNETTQVPVSAPLMPIEVQIGAFAYQGHGQVGWLGELYGNTQTAPSNVYDITRYFLSGGWDSFGTCEKHIDTTNGNITLYSFYTSGSSVRLQIKTIGYKNLLI